MTACPPSSLVVRASWLGPAGRQLSLEKRELHGRFVREFAVHVLDSVYSCPAVCPPAFRLV
ncbi:MAG: hypothetical protein M3392_04735 [Actinomycetota bacterium]|nr:hypothetical protein [Actinomycetota bacterium]